MRAVVPDSATETPKRSPRAASEAVSSACWPPEAPRDRSTALRSPAGAACKPPAADSARGEPAALWELSRPVPVADAAAVLGASKALAATKARQPIYRTGMCTPFPPERRRPGAWRTARPARRLSDGRPVVSLCPCRAGPPRSGRAPGATPRPSSPGRATRTRGGLLRRGRWKPLTGSSWLVVMAAAARSSAPARCQPPIRNTRGMNSLITMPASPDHAVQLAASGGTHRRVHPQAMIEAEN